MQEVVNKLLVAIYLDDLWDSSELYNKIKKKDASFSLSILLAMFDIKYYFLTFNQSPRKLSFMPESIYL